MFFDNDKTDAEVRADLEAKLWDGLSSSSPFVMLGLKGVEDTRTRPMTVQIDEVDGNKTIYFFADKRESIVQGITNRHPAVATFASKGHDIFAHIHGDLVIDNEGCGPNRAVAPTGALPSDLALVEPQRPPGLALVNIGDLDRHAVETVRPDPRRVGLIRVGLQRTRPAFER